MIIFKFIIFRVAATLIAIVLFVKFISITGIGGTWIGTIIGAFGIPLIALYAINTYDDNPKTLKRKKRRRRK